MFGSVSIQGAHADLQKGLENAAHDMNASTDMWVSPAGSSNLLMTRRSRATALDKLERAARRAAPSRLYRGGLLDWGQRRSG